MTISALRAHATRATLALAATCSLFAVVLSACGSSSSSSTSHTSTTAAKPTARPVPGTPSKPGATAPSTASLHKLHKVHKGSGVGARIGGVSGQPVDTQIMTLDRDLNGFWSKQFASSNIQWPQVQETLVTSSPVQTGCSSRATEGPNDPPFICNNVFFWGVPAVQSITSQPNGDASLAVIASIVWAAHVQDVLGYSQALDQGRMSKSNWASQSMCLSGVYISSLGQRNLFEQGDTQAVNDFLAGLKGVNGIGAPDVSQQSLSSAFATGFNSGDPATCTGG